LIWDLFNAEVGLLIAELKEIRMSDFGFYLMRKTCQLLLSHRVLPCAAAPGSRQYKVLTGINTISN